MAFMVLSPFPTVLLYKLRGDTDNPDSRAGRLDVCVCGVVLCVILIASYVVVRECGWAETGNRFHSF